MNCLTPLFTALLLALPAGLPAAGLLIVESLEGPVTAAEIAAFKTHMAAVPVAKDNLRNAMVYGPSGAAVEALGQMVEVTGDRELLDRMLVFTDAMLAGRNDPETGAIIWTGRRELVWPNQNLVKDGKQYSSTENGDVAGHIAYAARLIFDREKWWALKVPDGDPHGFGATYKERAVRYVHEMDRTMDTFVLKWLVRPGSLRLYTPDTPLYEAVTKPGTRNQPVPWNQQMMLNNGFQRLAECHALLGDDPERTKKYDAVVKASADWFFSNAQGVTVKGQVCCNWAYVAEDPLKHIEDYGHGGEDVGGLYRAYRSGRYGITQEMMEPLANTVMLVMRTPEGRFIPRVNGIATPKDRPPGGLGAKWLGLCEFAPGLLKDVHEISRRRIPTSHDLTAAILWHKHRRARQE